MPDLSNQKLITNRQLNFTLSPVDTHNSREMPYKLDNYEIDGTWNHHQSIILDVILDRFFRGYYLHQYKKLPKSWRSKEVIETARTGLCGMVKPEALENLNSSPYEAYSKSQNYDVIEDLRNKYKSLRNRYENLTSKENECPTFEQYVNEYFKHNHEFQEFLKSSQEYVKYFHGDFPISIDILKLYEDYPLAKYRYTLIDHLKKIEQTKFKMTYKVKYIAREPKFNDKGEMTDNGEQIDLYYQMQDFQHMFEVNAKKHELVLNFNTPLGKLILHNMLILDTDWCPFESMMLSKNAYFIYKRFVFNRRFGKKKAKEIELNFDELKNFLNLNWSNNGGVYAIIEKALKDMMNNELIGGFEYEKHHINKRRYKLYFGKVKKDQEKMIDEDAGILKFN